MHSLVGFDSTFSFGIKGVLALSIFLFAYSNLLQAATPAPAVNALPSNGQVVAGSAAISQTQTPNSATMNVNQSSQRAVINWDSFNVGKNATVNFNQPNANSVTLNRVTGATQSLIDGAVRANGQVIFVNPNGVTFGKGAEVNAAAVVATTLNMANQEFMDGKSSFKDDSTGVGSKAGKIINRGTIQTNQIDPANTEGGFIALLAPEVRNQGYLLAQKGGAVALGSGSQITLKIQGQSLLAINVDQGVYNGLIVNKHVVEAPGGLVVMAAGAANQLMSSVIKNTGRISANAAISNGGVIELVAKNITQAGQVTADSQASQGGQINLVGNEITVATNSKTTATGATGGGQVNIGLANTKVSGGSQLNTPTQTGIKANADRASSNNQLAQTVSIQENALIDTSATQTGNGGAIAIWSQLQTTVAGILKSMGGVLSGNGGFIETSSKASVSLTPTASINTSANNQSGKAGSWLLDPVDLIIDASTANTISTALATGNVTIAVTANTTACSVGSCIVNGTGLITIASGANILKAGTSYTTLTLSAAGNFSLNGSIEGQNLDVIIQSSIAYLGAGSSINASKVTVQAQTIIVASSAQILANNYVLSGGAGTLGNAIELLAQSIFISGTLRLSGGLPSVPAVPLTAVGLTTLNADQGLNKIYSSTSANDSSLLVVTTATQAASNVIYLTATQTDPTSSATVGLESSSQVLANGTTGGSVYLRGTDIYTRTGSVLQATGSAGDGGMIVMKADAIRVAGEVSAGGSVNGGSINLVATSGTLNLQGGVVQADGTTGTGGNIAALVTAAASFTADNRLSLGLASSSFDLSKALFITEKTVAATSGALSLDYEIRNAFGSTVTLGTGSYTNISITGTPSYYSGVSTITNSVGTGSYSNLIVQGLSLSGTNSGGYMLVAIPVNLTVTAAQSVVTPVHAVMTSAVPPQLPPPLAFAPPMPRLTPAKLEIASTLSPMVAPAPPVAANSPPPVGGGEVSMSAPIKAPPLIAMADGSIQLTPPSPPPAAPSAAATASGTQVPPPAAPPPAAPPPASRASVNREAANNSTSDPRRVGATRDGMDKADAKDRAGKPINAPSKYVSKYANGFRNSDKPASKEGSTKVAAADKPAPPRQGKYDNRINAMNNSPAALAAMKQNPFAGTISAFPPGVPHAETAPIVLRGGDSLAQSYDDVPSIRNSGVSHVGKSRTSENFHESLESVNLISTLNLFIIH